MSKLVEIRDQLRGLANMWRRRGEVCLDASVGSVDPAVIGNFASRAALYDQLAAELDALLEEHFA